jgi:Ethanolamine utilization protein EutJ (predicted chaperonin)
VEDPRDLELVVVGAQDGAVASTPFGSGVARPSIAADGSIAYVRLDDDSTEGVLAGALTLAPSADRPGHTVAAASDLRVVSVTAAPEPDGLVLSVVDEPTAAIWLLDNERGELTPLAMDGGHARWLP